MQKIVAYVSCAAAEMYRDLLEQSFISVQLLDELLMQTQVPKLATGGSVLFSYDLFFKTRESKTVFDRFIDIAKQCDWVQSGVAGTDDGINNALLNEDVMLATGAGIHAVPVATAALAQMLRKVRLLDEHTHDQKQKVWNQQGGMAELTDKLVVIYGFGMIATVLAEYCTVLGANVVGLKRSPQKGDNGFKVYSLDMLDKIVPQADFFVNLAPSTKQTEGIFDKQFFSEMKQDAMFLNFGRGSAVVEEDLVNALDSGEIACAALDAYVVEPLPQDSKLWDCKNCFLSFHDAAFSQHSARRLGERFVENLRLSSVGKKLVGLAS